MAEFGYNGIFFINFTGRTDWFSVLNPVQNSKFYPSVSGTVIFSELLPSLSGWMDYGKFRASWAQVGSINGVNTYEGVQTYNISNNQFNGQTTASLSGGGAPNPFLTPFTVTEKELGLEFRLLQNKLHLDVSYFDKVTTDQILNVQLSSASGYGSSKQNLGSLKNSGIEFMVEYTPIKTNDFTWTSSWNQAYLATEVLSVGKNVDGTPVEDFLVIYFNGTGNEFLGELHYTVGSPLNMLYTRTFRRDANGNQLVRDNGRLLASNSDTPGALANGFVPIGSSIPKFTGGWTNTFSYKNLTVGIHIDYKLGGYVLSSTKLNGTRQGHSKLSLEGREGGIIVDGVRESDGQPNTTAVTNLQSFTADYRNLQIGDPFTFKSDFVKLRNISISYNLTSAIQNVDFLKFFKGLTVTASCRNVAILHKDLENLDPEAVQSSGDTRAGYENSSLPTTRNFNFSLNARF
jgi:hypothetical protein